VTHMLPLLLLLLLLAPCCQPWQTGPSPCCYRGPAAGSPSVVLLSLSV
jgi:hypothetical protein